MRSQVLARQRSAWPTFGRRGASGQRTLVLYGPARSASRHERETLAGIAARLAALLGHDFSGHYDPDRRYARAPYFVPAETLSRDAAAALGIASERDLFGGVVPHAIVGTKAITHPLIAPGARAPRGWSAAFGRAVAGAVLSGYTAFSLEEARAAGLRLLASGPVRLKPARALGGRGQSVVRGAATLDGALQALAPEEVRASGLVVERNLNDVVTHSVGQVRVGDLLATYHGTQSLTIDNGGAQVYGGSDLMVARGGFRALLTQELSEGARRAIAQARIYDRAARVCFSGFFASRRNYDVAEGCYDGTPVRQCGVLEQSWRIGGASGAEIAALEAFRRDVTLNLVRAASVEVYGSWIAPPPGATVYFRGIDEAVGLISKYAVVYPHADAR